jgi:hypothetical protein
MGLDVDPGMGLDVDTSMGLDVDPSMGLDIHRWHSMGELAGACDTANSPAPNAYLPLSKSDV